jgi:hypothetical protein
MESNGKEKNGYQFSYLKIVVQGLWGSLFKSRICLPHFIERQCALEIHAGTAPQGRLHRDGSRSCLSGGLLLAGLGAFDTLSRICDATFEKRPPRPFNLLMVLSKH